jgi:hypothetical protein
MRNQCRGDARSTWLGVTVKRSVMTRSTNVSIERYARLRARLERAGLWRSRAGFPRDLERQKSTKKWQRPYNKELSRHLSSSEDFRAKNTH